MHVLSLLLLQQIREHYGEQCIGLIQSPRRWEESSFPDQVLVEQLRIMLLGLLGKRRIEKLSKLLLMFKICIRARLRHSALQ